MRKLFLLLTISLLTIWSGNCHAFTDNFDIYNIGELSGQNINRYSTGTTVYVSDTKYNTNPYSLNFNNQGGGTYYLLQTKDVITSAGTLSFQLYLDTMTDGNFEVSLYDNNNNTWSAANFKGGIMITPTTTNSYIICLSHGDGTGQDCRNFPTSTWNTVIISYTQTEMAYTINGQSFSNYYDLYYASNTTNAIEIWGNPHYNFYLDNLTNTETIYIFSTPCAEYNNETECENNLCEWLTWISGTTTEQTESGTTTVNIESHVCVGSDTINPYTDIIGGIIYGTTTTSTLRNIFQNKAPFSYFWLLTDTISFLRDYMETETLNPISISIPTIYGTGTHATTVIMTSFEIPIIDQTWFYTILPEETWQTLKSLFSASIIILFLFGILNLIKTFLYTSQ